MKNSFKITSLPAKILLLIFVALAVNARAQLTVTLTPSNYNGTNISCFGVQDGSIAANPLGGMAPYTYSWSNGATIQTITGLAAGYYRVQVKDNAGAIEYGELTLTEPEALTLDAVPYIYPNGYNISCYSCANGIIDVYANSGMPSYTFLWSDGNTNQSRTALSPGTYAVTVTDLNGCTSRSEGIYLTEPARSDWTILGNAGSNPSTNFIGTTDNKDLVFKTNNSERIKVKANGDMKVGSLAGSGIGFVYADSNGVLNKYGGGGGTPISPGPFWETAGNDNVSTTNYIGTKNNADLIFKTNVTASFGLGEVMRLTANGKVAIGTTYIPTGYKLAVDGKVICTEVKVKNRNQWPDYVFKEDYQKINLDDLEKYINLNHHLPDVISGNEEEKEGHELGAMDAVLLKKIEELTLYVIDLNKCNNALNCELNKIKQQLVTIKK